MSKHKIKTGYKVPLWKLVLISSIASFFALLPANIITSMASYFHVTTVHAAGVLSWFLLGYGTGPLLYAPLANRYGRRRALLIGFCIGLLAAIISGLAVIMHMFYVLLISRYISGVGVSAGLVVGMMMLADTSTEQESRRTFSIIVLFFSFMPSLAITCGSFMFSYLGLASIFILMFAMMVLWILLARSLQETSKVTLKQLNWTQALGNYKSVLQQPKFVAAALIMTAASAIMYVFNGLGPVIALKDLGMSVVAYGKLAIVPSFGLFVGAGAAGFLSKRYTAQQSMQVGLAISAIAAAVMLYLFYRHYISIWSLLTPAGFMFMGAAIIIPNSSMQALAVIKDKASASSVLNAQALILSSLAVSAVSSMLYCGGIVLPLSLLALALIGWFCLWFTKPEKTSMRREVNTVL